MSGIPIDSMLYLIGNYVMDKKYFRNCTVCEKYLGYTNKKNRNFAEKHKKYCLSCSQKDAHKRPDVLLKNKRRACKLSERYKGSGNPFFGKKHSKETKERLRQIALDNGNPITLSKIGYSKAKKDKDSQRNIL